MSWRFWAALGSVVAAVSLAEAGPSRADAVQDFYKGKQITVIVGGDAGGAHDAFTRVLVRHMGRHIPGEPAFVVQNMPGAGGILAANHIANVAPRDGTVIASLYPANLVQPLLERDGKLKYDPRTLAWIGSLDSFQIACFTSKRSAVHSVADAREHEVIVGSSSPTSSSTVMANVMNQLIGTKFKIVSGYATGNLILAVERGEVDGICGWAFATILQNQPKWVSNKEIRFLAQTGFSHVPELEGVPAVSDFVSSPEDKATLALLDMRTAPGRPYVAPPGVPADRIAALRAAFEATMADPLYREDAKKAQQGADFTSYQELEKLIASAYAMPPSVIQRARALSSGPAAN